MKEDRKLIHLIRDAALATLYAVLISVILALALAMVIKFTSIGDSALKIIDQAIKIISLLFGLMMGIKQPANGAIKGTIVGLLHAIISSLMLSLLDKSALGNVFDWIDILFTVAIGGISGILAVNIKSK